jgi:hypothetical protein
VGRNRRRRADHRQDRGSKGKLRRRVEWELSPLAAHAGKIATAAQEAGDPVPDECIPPDILPECLFAYRAFGDLASDRSAHDTALGAIPWTAIDAYCRRYGIIDPDEFERTIALIRAMEEAEIKYRQG